VAKSERAGLLLASALLALALGCSGQKTPKAPPAKLGAKPAAKAVVSTPTAPAEPVPATPAPPATGASPEEPGARELQPGEETPDEGSGEEPEGGVATSDPEALLHDALDAYEAAGTLWAQGSADQAMGELDHAYALMLAVPAGDNALLAHEKENLRHLVARRVVEIYASRQTAVGSQEGSIPHVMNADVQAEIASFQGRERAFFLEAYRRSGLYRPMILAQLKEAGLPEQLAWLPIVESGFKERALSTARALGLWQFIPSTGYRYGLDRSSWVDERMDPDKATRAALAYLSALHDLFGDWLTALASYNCGEQNVLRQINNQKVSYFDQFWDLYGRLPRETRRYVPRFLATLEIVENPAKYGFELPQPMAPVVFETAEVARAVQLEALDKAMGFVPGTLAGLNPELRRNATPEAPYKLKVPPQSGATLLASLDTLPKWTPPPMASTSTHRVRSGETLSKIATMYRTSVSQLMALNRLRRADRLSIGQQLQVPGSGRTSSSSSASAPPKVASIARSDTPAGTLVQYRVRSGDNLWLIAARYGTTVERIRDDNGLRNNFLQVGQVLTIRAGSS
jgi:membrane-bound lytic murein transglycosylase D